MEKLIIDAARAVLGCDRLAAAEAEIEVWEPGQLPTEPPLTNDELVALRGIIQERYAWDGGDA